MAKAKINFYGVGTQKGGTTSLHEILRQHPDIFLPETKEIHFFDKEELYSRGFDWYLDTFFGKYNGEKICGEFTPEYSFFASIPERILKTAGKDIKILFVFRNPVDRAFSHYLMTKRRIREELSFEDAIRSEEVRMHGGDYNAVVDFSYLSRGMYSHQVKRYLQYFPIESMLFLRFEEDLILNPEETVQRILKFLGVDLLDLNVNIRANPAQEPIFPNLNRLLFGNAWLKRSTKRLKRLKMFLKPIIEPRLMKKARPQTVNSNTRRNLNEHFKRDVLELEEITGLDLSNWKIQ